MNKKVLAANWKMKGDLELCAQYRRRFTKVSSNLTGRLEVVVCPPAPLLGALSQGLGGEFDGLIDLGAQDVTHIPKPGAFTGETHPSILREVGVSHAIIGHSERRRYLNESDKLIGEKLANCIRFGITPILCVGESRDERENGHSNKVIQDQLTIAFDQCREVDCGEHAQALIAYEPFWAIGSGQAATPDIIADIHGMIRRHCTDSIRLPADRFRILYGGSVNRDNAEEIAATEGVDGGLIGGASLDAEHFTELSLQFAQ